MGLCCTKVSVRQKVMAEISAKLLISKADQSFQTFIRAKVKYSLMSQSGTAADPQETESLQNIFLFLSLFGFCGSSVTVVLISHPWSILADISLFQSVLPVYWALLQNSCKYRAASFIVVFRISVLSLTNASMASHINCLLLLEINLKLKPSL